jgi:hypothetical protein
MPSHIDCVRAYASLGEICDAMRAVPPEVTSDHGNR